MCPFPQPGAPLAVFACGLLGGWRILPRASRTSSAPKKPLLPNLPAPYHHERRPLSASSSAEALMRSCHSPGRCLIVTAVARLCDACRTPFALPALFFSLRNLVSSPVSRILRLIGLPQACSSIFPFIGAALVTSQRKHFNGPRSITQHRRIGSATSRAFRHYQPIECCIDLRRVAHPRFAKRFWVAHPFAQFAKGWGPFRLVILPTPSRFPQVFERED